VTPARWRSAGAARLLFAATVLTNLALLYWPRDVGGGGPAHLDKVVHVVAFAAVAWTGLRAQVPAAWLLPVLALHAAVSEVVQARLLPDRSGDVADVLADLSGILAGTVLARASWRDEPAVRTAGRH